MIASTKQSPSTIEQTVELDRLSQIEVADNNPTSKESSRKVVISKDVARQLRAKLLQKVCSAAWLDAICSDPEHFEICYYDPDVYPSDWFVFCPACRKKYPKNTTSTCCCDCETEIGQFRFLKRLSCVNDLQFARNLINLWWRPPVQYINFVDRVGPISDSDNSEFDDSLLWETLKTFEKDSITVHGDAPARQSESTLEKYSRWSEIHYRLGLQSDGVRLVDPISRSSLDRLPREVADSLFSILNRWDRIVVNSVKELTRELRRATRSLLGCKIKKCGSRVQLTWNKINYCLMRCQRDFSQQDITPNSGRAAGCQFRLLAEDEKSLQREIEAFHHKGEIVKSARRFRKTNPLNRGRQDEDDRSALDCFITLGDDELDAIAIR